MESSRKAIVKLYYHHVGQRGSVDFDKTVFNDVGIFILDAIPDASVREDTITKIWQLFPSGQFNCWGVPVGAGPVINNLAENDYVLLIQSTRIDGFIPALCRVKFYLQYPQPALSKALWGDDKFPYIFFFDTQIMDLAWIDFIDQLNYRERYNPRGQFLSVADEKLSNFGGAEGYIRFIHEHFSSDNPLFTTITTEELNLDKDKIEHSALNTDDVNMELSKICNISLKEGDNPALKWESKETVQNVRERDAAFGIAVKRLYGNRCAVCNAGAYGPNGETEVEAAHIFPKSLEGSDNVKNGICLCRRHHWAFDVGWFVISDEFKVVIHGNLPNEPEFDFVRRWQNQRVNLPRNEELKPHLMFLRARRQLMGYQ